MRLCRRLLHVPATTAPSPSLQQALCPQKRRLLVHSEKRAGGLGFFLRGGATSWGASAGSRRVGPIGCLRGRGMVPDAGRSRPRNLRPTSSFPARAAAVPLIPPGERTSRRPAAPRLGHPSGRKSPSRSSRSASLGVWERTPSERSTRGSPPSRSSGLRMRRRGPSASLSRS